MSSKGVFGVPEAGSQDDPQPDGRTSSTEAIGDFSDGNSSNFERVQSFDLDPFERSESSASVLEKVPTPRIDDLADQNISAVLISSAPKLGPASTLLHGDNASTTADDGDSVTSNGDGPSRFFSSRGIESPGQGNSMLRMLPQSTTGSFGSGSPMSPSHSQMAHSDAPQGHPAVEAGQDEMACPFMMLQAAIESSEKSKLDGKAKLSGTGGTESPKRTLNDPPAKSNSNPKNVFSTRGSAEASAEHEMAAPEGRQGRRGASSNLKVKGGAGTSGGPAAGGLDPVTSEQLADQDALSKDALAMLSCPMTGFLKRRGSSGNLSVSSAGASSQGGASQKSLSGKHGNSGSRNQKLMMMAQSHGRHRNNNSHTLQSHESSQGGNSRNSSGGTGGRRRVNKLGQFSIYEASNYEPLIRSSWLAMQENMTKGEIGMMFYMKFFHDNVSLHSMFTRSQEVMGEKFSEILGEIVSAVEDVTMMKNKLKALAPMHLRVGVKTEHAGIMGKALMRTFETVLKERWTSEVSAAWEWLWSWLTQLFQQSLEDAINEATVLTYSWDLALDNNTEEEMGNLLFDTLFELAPNLKSVYGKPRQILSSKFVEMMSTLVSFHGDSMRMEEQIAWLGFRHIKYGAQAQHVRVMGDVLIETMSRAVGEDWTSDMAEAWMELWLKCCELMMQIIHDAKQHGHVVQDAWKQVRAKTTEVKFGSTLRKLLLAGTEWVASLSHGIMEEGSDLATSGQSENHLDMSAQFDGGFNVGSKTKSKIKNKLTGKGLNMSSRNGSSELGNEEFAQIFKAEDIEKNGPGKGEDGALALGQHFWDMLSRLLDLLWEPEKQNEVLIVMTTRLFHWGIRSSHLDTIGTSLSRTMQKMTGQDWSEEQNAAWAWWWSMTSKAMQKTLHVCEQQHSQTIRSTWELCKTLSSPQDLGQLWFKELARIAPHVLHLFKRPKKIQAAQFMAVVDMLVTFVENPALFFEGFKALTIRHIKYGVKAEYAKAFGKSILIGIEKTLGDKYDEATSEAWTMLWTRASSCVSRALNVGTNPVILALVDGDLEKLSSAMDCASRGERFDWLSIVDVNGDVYSPLYWTLRDGNFEMARYIITDLLTIRADREDYYYGREILFQRHPDIVTVLCRDSPQLLNDALFDGLMWHSKDVKNSTIRVNYYIQELFGNPEKESDVWGQALSTLAEKGKPEMFSHPVAAKLLEVKWNRIGKVFFLGTQAIWFIVLIVFMTANIEYHIDCRFEWLRYVLGGVCVILTIAQTAMAVHHWRLGWVVPTNFKFSPVQIMMPRLLSQFWNLCRFFSTLLLSMSCFLETCHTNDKLFHNVANSINAFIGVFLWLQMLQSLVVSTRLAALTFKLGYMFEDVFRNLLVVGIFTMGFAASLTCLGEEHFEEFGSSASVLLRVFLGADPPEMITMGSLGLFFIFAFIIFVVLGMLNILIAQLWSTYEEIHHHKQGLAMMHRAEICIQMESILPISWRQKVYDDMGFDKAVPFNLGDEGPSGGIQYVEPASARNNKFYKPDRVQRFTGDANKKDPWPCAANQDDYNMAMMGDDEYY